MSKIEILRTMDYLRHIVEAIDRIHRTQRLPKPMPTYLGP